MSINYLFDTSMKQNLIAEGMGVLLSAFFTYVIVALILQSRNKAKWKSYKNLIHSDLSRITLKLLRELLSWAGNYTADDILWFFGDNQVTATNPVRVDYWKYELSVTKALESLSVEISLIGEDGVKKHFLHLKQEIGEVQNKLRPYTFQDRTIFPPDLFLHMEHICSKINLLDEQINIFISRKCDPLISIILAHFFCQLLEDTCTLYEYLFQNVDRAVDADEYIKEVRAQCESADQKLKATLKKLNTVEEK
jgi:hypothetical protein